MSRFQAQTTAPLEEELSDLRKRLGLRENQKAELLREIAELAAWVVRQAEAGRRIEARRGRDVETLRSPVIERLSGKQDEGLVERIDLTETEAERLAEILEGGFSPTPALRKALSRLADPKRRWERNSLRAVGEPPAEGSEGPPSLADDRLAACSQTGAGRVSGGLA